MASPFDELAPELGSRPFRELLEIEQTHLRKWVARIFSDDRASSEPEFLANYRELKAKIDSLSEAHFLAIYIKARALHKKRNYDTKDNFRVRTRRYLSKLTPEEIKEKNRQAQAKFRKAHKKEKKSVRDPELVAKRIAKWEERERKRAIRNKVKRK